MTAIAIDCRTDIATHLKEIPALVNRVHEVDNPDQLAQMIKNTQSTAQVGVVYQGMSAQREVGKTPRGLAATVQVGLYLAVDAPLVIAGVTSPNSVQAITMLDAMRAAILEKSSPTGHKWEFVSEGYAEANAGKHLWVQQWRTLAVR